MNEPREMSARYEIIRGPGSAQTHTELSVRYNPLISPVEVSKARDNAKAKTKTEIHAKSPTESSNEQLHERALASPAT